MSEKNWEHPAVRRGKVFWSAQPILFGLLTVAFVFLAVRDQAFELLAYAAGAAILGVLFGFSAKRQIKKLRHEYRYQSDADSETAMERTGES
ncbi:hypothetical protein [Arthrobacter glacialis]|uniref:Uncharacterized protein n=1 Tax=Arthrobacter glacialis TaxID=1664 RepID=A0A2S3ZR38_ARTGL|nr:hypothetical protein [Arthrobacter glacialis]POH57743.1 hypothetical protein CVS28_14605 [Arthrobacter glacialis]POH71696.1 hypothetical protein CVS27_19725 [Arthrobacter glacialis]